MDEEWKGRKRKYANNCNKYALNDNIMCNTERSNCITVMLYHERKTYQQLIDCLHQQACQSSCQKHTTKSSTSFPSLVTIVMHYVQLTDVDKDALISKHSLNICVLTSAIY